MKGFSEGEEISVKGIVAHSRASGNERKYLLKTGDATFCFRSRDFFGNGDIIHIEGVLEDLADLNIKPKSIKVLEGEDAKAVFQEVEKKIKVELKDSFISENDATAAMKERIRETARKLLATKELNRYVLLRFHGDADGIAGALALRKALRFRAYQQNSAIYSARDAVNDLGNLHHENRPMVVLLDFGTNRESLEGLRLLKAAGIEAVAIDHHPLEEEARQYLFLLSPWTANLEDASKYTAGYLAAEIANLCGVEKADEYARIACAGDKSDVVAPSEDDRKTALVLDYLAAHASFGNSLGFYGDVLEKEELFSSIWHQASEKINEALERALPKIKKTEKNGILIYIVPLDGIVEPKQFPNRSKVTTAVFEKFRTDSPMVTLGYGKRVVIARGNEAFVKRGLAFSDIIKKVSSDMKDFVSAGGGHAKAAAIRVEEGYEKSVIDKLVEELK